MSVQLRSDNRQHSTRLEDVAPSAAITSDLAIGSADAIESPGAWNLRALPYRELKRRFWHMAPGLLAFGLHLEPHADPITPTLRWIIVAACALIALRIFSSFRQIQRQGEGTVAAAVAGYAFSVLFTILLFPSHLEIGVAVLSILAFGDGSATLIGLMLRGPRLPWNQSKSWSGLLAFCIIGILMTSWIYWGETRNPESANPPVSFTLTMLIVAPAVVAAALAESLKMRLNDNIRVGVVAAKVLTISHFLLRGFGSVG